MMHLITMRVGVITSIVVIMGVAVAAPAEVESKKPDRTPDRAQFVQQTFGPGAVVRAGASAAINQGLDTPHEWGQGAAGFGKRLGSALGKHIINKSIHYTVARIRHEEFGYHSSGKQGFGPRLKYALVSTVVTHKTTTGKPTIAAGELSGAFGSGLISRLWQPASLHTVSSGIASGGLTLGIDAGSHVLREFWPEIRHPHRHSRVQSAQETVQPASYQSNSTERDVDVRADGQ